MRHTLLFIGFFFLLIMSAQAQSKIETENLINDLELKIKNEKKYYKKVEYLNDLAKAQVTKSEYDEAEKTYESLLDLVTSKKDTSKMAETLFELLEVSGNDKTMRYAELLESLYKNKRDVNYYYVGMAQFYKAFEFRVLQNTSKSIENLFLAHDSFKKVDSTKTPEVKYMLIVTNDQIAESYIDVNEYDKALKVYDKVIDLIGNNTEEYGDFFGNMHITSADIELQKRDTTKALSHLNKGYEIFTKRKDTLNTCVMLMNIGALQLDLKQHDKALKKFVKALYLLKKIKGNDLIPSAYLFMGEFHADIKKYEVAHKYIDSSISFSESRNCGSTNSKINAAILRSEIYEYQEKNNLAISTLEDALGSFENPENFQNMLMTINKNLSRIYNENKKPLKSAKYLNRYLEIKESELAKKNDGKIKILEVEYNYRVVKDNLEKKDMALKINQLEQKQFSYNIFFASSSAFLLFGLFLYNIIKRKKQEKIEYELVKSRHESMLINKRILDRELELKKINATDFSLQINDKINLLKKIAKQLQTVKPLNSHSKAVISNTISFLNEEIHKNNTSPKLLSEVDKINSNFKSKIEENFKNLTKKEQKIAILVRMGKSSKQIAQKLDISIASVDNYRFNIRKKMNVPKGKNLKKFIASIS